MVDKLQKLREPLAFVVVGAFALRLVLSLGAFAVYTASIGPVSAALSALDPISGGLLALTGTVIVGSCAVWGDPTPRARFLVLTAAVLFAVEVAVGVLIGIVGLFAGNPFGTLVQMLHLVLPALAAVVLYTILQGLPAPVARQQPVPGWPQQPAPQETGPRPSGTRPSGPGLSGPQQPGPQHPAPPQPGLQHQPGPQQPAPQQPAPHQAGPQQPGPQQPAPQQPAHQQPHPGQHGGPPPPAASGPPLASGAPQTGQAGAPEQIAPEPGRDVDAVDWQPAPQQPPQRLQPSPHHPAVGPHSRPDSPTADRTTTERPAEGAKVENSAAQAPGSGQSTHRRGDERRG